MEKQNLDTLDVKIRIVVVEDDVDVMDWMQRAIELACDMQLQGTVGTRAQGLALIDGPSADVLLVDLGLPDGSGIDVIRKASTLWPDCAIMVITTYGDELHVMESLKSGAKGYLLKDSSLDSILAEIRTLHKGGSPISPLIARQILNRFMPPVLSTLSADDEKKVHLSQREHEALVLITKGFSAEEIAGMFNVSRHTVQTFVRRIYKKLEVNSKAEAIFEARQRGFLHD